MENSTAAGALAPCIEDAGKVGVLVPPSVVQTLALVGGRVLHEVAPIAVLPGVAIEWLGWCILAPSVVVLCWAAWDFHRVKTTTNFRKAAAVLVTSGTYTFSRNPTYIGFLAIIVGVALRLNSAWILAMFVPTALFFHYNVILREEAYLERRFAGAYLAYKTSVRRYL